VSIQYAGSTNTNYNNGDCQSVSSDEHQPLAPGSECGTVTTHDTEGASDSDDGCIQYQAIPFVTSSVDGYPDLDQIEKTDLGTVVNVKTLVTENETVRGYEVTTDGTVLLSNLGSVDAQEGDYYSNVEWDRSTDAMVVDIKGQEEWSGTVENVGGKWWHLMPADDFATVSDDESNPGPYSFDVLDISPVEETVPLNESHGIDNDEERE